MNAPYQFKTSLSKRKRLREVELREMERGREKTQEERKKEGVRERGEKRKS